MSTTDATTPAGFQVDRAAMRHLADAQVNVEASTLAT